ncbi:MAG: DUF2617 family protein [Aeoliella sp.]
MLSTRPKVAELVFQFYGRSLHPELFEVQRERKVERKRYSATLKITGMGHVITWQRPEGMVLTEVATSARHELPMKRRLMSHRLRSEQHDSIECAGGLLYETEFSLDPIDARVIQIHQQELQLTGAKEGLMHEFASSGRIGIGAFSYIHFQSRNDSLRIQAIHTFPDDGVILKSQSAFLLPKA